MNLIELDKKYKIKKILAVLLISLIVFSLVNIGYNSYITRKEIDKNLEDIIEGPIKDNTDDNVIDNVVDNIKDKIDNIIDNINKELNSIKVKELTTANKDLEFTTNDEIVLTIFTTNIKEDNELKQVLINDNLYNVKKIKNNHYQVNLGKLTNVKSYTYNLKMLILNDKTEIKVKEELTVYIIKSKPSLNFTNTDNEQLSNLTLNLNLTDNDNTIISLLTVNLIDSNNNIITKKIDKAIKELTFDNIKDEKYQVEILADIKIGKDNLKNETLIKKEINILSRYYVLKDITDVIIYKMNGDEVIRTNDKITNSNKSNYLVEIKASNANSFYTTIKEVVNKHNNTSLILNSNRVINYTNNTRNNNLIVDYPFKAENLLKLNNNLIKNKKETLLEIDNSILGYNLQKIMPYYDSKYYNIDKIKLANNELLNSKLIKTILPMINDKTYVSLNDENYLNVTKIKVVFEDDTLINYSLTNRSFNDGIASYNITELDISYNYNKLIIKNNNDTSLELKRIIDNFTYEENIYFLSNGDKTETDFRIYNDYFNTVKQNSNLFIDKLLSNTTSYNITINNNILNKKVLNEIIKDSNLEKILFVYTYINRLYDVNIGNVNLSDVLFFDDTIINNKLTTEKLVEEVVKSTNNQRSFANNTSFYTTYLKKYTNKDTVISFIEHFISKIAGYSDVNDWIIDNFKGIIVEAQPKLESAGVKYRAWEFMKNNAVVRNGTLILPILSIPSNDMYILSVPSQLAIGSMNVYKEYKSNDPATREIMRNKITNYGNRVADFYNNVIQVANNAVFNLNRTTNLQIDQRIMFGVLQDPKTSEEPIVKNIYTPLGINPAANGSGAYANGNGVWWVVYDMLNNFWVFTHETAHNQDGRVFLEGRGRRNGGYAEDFSDGNIQQSFSYGSLNANFSSRYQKDSNITSNLTPERINSPTKIQDFYQKMFETINSLDYFEALAFLQLTPKEQSKIAMQHYYPKQFNEFDVTADARTVSKWRVLSEDKFIEMNLTLISDLWNNGLSINYRKGDGFQVGINSYGGESILDVYWYQPHNDFGRPNSNAFKRLSREMLAEAGYSDGYVGYSGYIYPNDLVALQAITKNPIMTWEKYKYSKYDEIKNKMNNNFIDSELLIELFKKAFELDATSTNPTAKSYSTTLRGNLYLYLQRITNDFEMGIYDNSNAIHIQSSSQLINSIKNNPTGNYVLDNDIDLSGFSGIKSLTDVIFIGRLNGNGYTIKNMSMPLFTEIKYSYIENIKFDKAEITSTITNVGILSRISSNSIINNISLTNSKLIGNVRVGGLVGTDTQSVFSKISTDIDVVINEDRGGSILAETNGTMLINCYSNGSVTQTSNAYLGGWHIGGLVGRLYNESGINNCYSNTYIDQKNKYKGREAGGLFGKSEGNHSIINSLSTSNGNNIYKFDGHTKRNDYKNGYYNNFEYEESNGLTNQGLIDTDMNGIINVVTKEHLYTKEFFINVLKFNNNIWNFDSILNEKLPTFK